LYIRSVFMSTRIYKWLYLAGGEMPTARQSEFLTKDLLPF
jgi:hypothetical protein